jgi:hypothetical protein
MATTLAMIKLIIENIKCAQLVSSSYQEGKLDRKSNKDNVVKQPVTRLIKVKALRLLCSC